jgi:heat shock protein 4
MKLLVGRKFDDADVQREISKNPYTCVKLPSGGVGVSIVYDDKPLVVSAEHFLAIVLTKAKEIASKANNNVSIGDAVLAVPHWFTESQRRAVLMSCEIASLNCLKITNETNATALSYGIFKSAKKLFSETEPNHMMFIDIGFTGYSVTIVDFIQENMKVLSTVCDRDLGGRDFDDVIIEYQAEVFQKKTGIDVRKNKKAILKLQAAAEKAKKTLSPAGVNEANISVECLAEDHDCNCVLSREEFEKRCASLVARLRAPVEQALAEAKLTKDQIFEIEIVGGSSRVNIIKRTLGEILGLDPAALNYGLKTTMNADEPIARGGALQCAMLSSFVKVKPFNIVDKVPYGIVAHFDAATTSDDADESVAKGSSVSIYSRLDDLPHKPRRLTFKNKTSDFAITLAYDDAAVAHLPAGESRLIGKFTIKIPAAIGAAAPVNDVRVTWNLDKNGFVYVQSAQLLEEIKVTEEEALATAAATAAEGKEAEAPKKRFKKTDLEVHAEHPGLTRDEIRAAIDLEGTMAFEDRLITETADKRNELEAYLYSMRDKIEGALKTFGSAAEKDKLKALIQAAEDWLYGDGFEASKKEYSTKLDELRAISNLMEFRSNETQNRPAAIESLKKQIEMCKNFSTNYDESKAHITEDERSKLRKEIDNTETWMYDMISKQGDLRSYHDPVLTAESINHRRNDLFKVSKPIMTKPKPEPAATPNTAESKSGESTPMDQSKGGPEEDKNSSKESK